MILEYPKAYAIFIFLTQNMDNYNAVMCSNKTLQERFGIGRTTVYNAIKYLVKKKALKIYKSGSSNVYCLNKQIVWHSYGKYYKYAKFGTNVLLSESEQKKYRGEK